MATSRTYNLEDSEEVSIQEQIRRHFEQQSLTEPESPDSSTSSIEYDPEFTRILEEHRQTSMMKSQSLIQNSYSENTETEPDISLDVKRMFRRVMESPNCYRQSIWRQESDDSFLRMEALCNQTIRSIHLNPDDDTQLFDVEPPSQMWDQTLTDSCEGQAGTSKLTPMKMVGLTRPSTILEESFNESNSVTENQIIQPKPDSVYKPRDSIFNVFPKRRRKFFDDDVDFMLGLKTPTTTEMVASPTVQFDRTRTEQNPNLITFDDSYVQDETIKEDPNQSVLETTYISDDCDPGFNDTVEAMDFFMSHRKRMLNKEISMDLNSPTQTKLLYSAYKTEKENQSNIYGNISPNFLSTESPKNKPRSFSGSTQQNYFSPTSTNTQFPYRKNFFNN